MSAGRVEAFSDGVIAIIITIMVLELKVPGDASAKSLLGALTVAIMWVNHHHYLKNARRADAALLWANNNLLFWMSLIPFATRYLGQNLVQPLPVAVYGGVLAVTAAAFYWLIGVLGRHNVHHPVIAAEYRRQRRKSAMTVLAYVVCASLSKASARLALSIMIVLPLLYFLPERKLLEEDEQR
jgi:uncharacterized membrane protein